MDTKVTPRYDSLTCFIPLDLQDDFIEECKFVGLDAGRLQCFSLQKVDEILKVIYDRWEEYAPRLLKILSALKSKHKIKIEISADRKVIDLEGVSVEDALKILKAADGIKISHHPLDVKKDDL